MGKLVENSPQVSVVLAPIVRTFRSEGGGHGRWAIAFRLVPPADLERALAVVRAVLPEVNASVPPQKIIGLGAIRIGKRIVIPMYGDGVSTGVVEPWVRTLAVQLEAAGESGILQRTVARGYKDPPVVPLGLDRELAPVAYITYEHAEVESVGDAAVLGWSVVPEVRQQLATYAAAWPQMRRGRAWLLWEEVAPLDPDQVESAMLAIGAGVGGGVIYDAEEPWGQRNLMVGPGGGELVVSSWTVDSVDDWRGWVDEITTALRVAPMHTKQAFIRNCFQSSRSIFDLYSKLLPEQVRPMRSSRFLDFYPVLARNFVCDAHGRQILNGHHVSRIRNLDRNWEVEEVAVDRFLVSAKDMQPWFGVDITPLEVLHRARRDFFDIILTWDAALAVDPDLESTLVHGREELMKPIDISLA